MSNFYIQIDLFGIKYKQKLLSVKNAILVLTAEIDCNEVLTNLVGYKKEG